MIWAPEDFNHSTYCRLGKEIASSKLSKVLTLSELLTNFFQIFYDVTFAAKIDLKSDLIPDSSGRVRPLSFDESSEWVIKSESNTLQNSIVEFQEFANTNLLKINPTKSQVITFNFSYKYRFPTEIEVSQSENLRLSSCAKILGCTYLQWPQMVKEYW